MNNYMYMIDNKCYLKLKKTNIKEIIYDNAILDNSVIKNTYNFIKETINYLIKNKMFNYLFERNMDCIIDPLLSERDKEVIIYCMHKLNFKANIINTIDLLDLNNKNYIEYCSNTIIIYYSDKYNNKLYKVIPNNYFPDKSLEQTFINSIIKSKKTYVFGSNITYKEFLRLIDQYDCELYLIENPEKYALSMYTKRT